MSHATADKWIARTICEKIEAVGAETFRDDRDINGGDDIPDSIQQAIQDCEEVLVLLTPQSLNRPWVLGEIGAAWGLRKRIVAIRYSVEPEQVPEMIRSRKSLDLNELDAYLADVRARIRGGA